MFYDKAVRYTGLNCTVFLIMVFNQANEPELVPHASVLPALHAYCHSSSCQSSFGPRYQYGIGFEDGEGSERAWSKLTPFLAKTQIMTMANRRDMISHKAEWINVSILEKVHSLKSRHSHAPDIIG